MTLAHQTKKKNLYRMSKKNKYILLLLSIAVLFASVYKHWIGTGIRGDPFVFCDRFPTGRLVSNILKDLSNMFTISLLLFLWYYTCSTKALRKIIMPFFIISLADVVDYFLFCKQYSIVKLPLLIIMIIIFNYKVFLNAILSIFNYKNKKL